jgi:hypothetical protein
MYVSQLKAYPSLLLNTSHDRARPALLSARAAHPLAETASHVPSTLATVAALAGKHARGESGAISLIARVFVSLHRQDVERAGIWGQEPRKLPRSCWVSRVVGLDNRSYLKWMEFVMVS